MVGRARNASLWGRIWAWRSRGESVSNVVVVVLLIVLALYAWATRPFVGVVDQPASNPASSGPGPAAACPRNPVIPRGGPLKVGDAQGTAQELDVFVGRGGKLVMRQSVPLAIQSGALKAGTDLCVSASDLVNGDGMTLPADQVATWATVDNDDAHVTVYFVVSPRFQQVSEFGGYTGTISLNDQRAVGADIPVDVHVEYPDLNFVIVFTLLASFGGFVWGRIVHIGTKGGQIPELQPFWINLVLRIAIMIVTAVPVLNSQVLSNPDWAGDLSQYISVGSLAGAAAIAATPTLSALVDRFQRTPLPRRVILVPPRQLPRGRRL
jgi:hypothetical protein